MVNKIKVLIGDDSVEYGIACASSLRNLGLHVVTRAKDGNIILDAIKTALMMWLWSMHSSKYRCNRAY